MGSSVDSVAGLFVPNPTLLLWGNRGLSEELTSNTAKWGPGLRMWAKGCEEAFSRPHLHSLRLPSHPCLPVGGRDLYPADAAAPPLTVQREGRRVQSQSLTARHPLIVQVLQQHAPHQLLTHHVPHKAVVFWRNPEPQLVGYGGICTSERHRDSNLCQRNPTATQEMNVSGTTFVVPRVLPGQNRKGPTGLEVPSSVVSSQNAEVTLTSSFHLKPIL